MPVPNYAQFRSTVRVRPLRGYSGLHLTPDLAEIDEETLRARVIHKPGLVRLTQGEEVTVDRVAHIISPKRAIEVTDQITLPDGTTPPIVRVVGSPDYRGKTRVFKVSFGPSRRAQ